jgi:hypothetical protein
MPKSKIDQAREERITNEIVVDCYNESERFSGWCCYLEDKLKFPFRARCVVTDPVSPLKRGEEIEVIGLLGDDRPSPGGNLRSDPVARPENGCAPGSIKRRGCRSGDCGSHCRLALLVRAGL